MLRKERSVLTKNKLFETAVKLIKEKGYDEVTVSEICEKSGVAKGTFYVHYKSKEDIVKESYYSDMREFVLKKYEELVCKNRKIDIKSKIEKFIISEFMFADHVGYMVTCRAYVTNLSECITGDSKHFERRNFTDVLKILISEGINESIFETEQTKEEIFLYLESFVRGIMASWCFSSGKFDIVKEGKKYTDEILRKL
ncbi:TetR/AcrR family transcriptional regulator [Clostridium felsineum]|uniref:TetR/AcrR family transcriptional regulator n=1 Tax=Clostridium felsineum TaxID=36839 RepID=UPI00098CAD8A|nr:TetR/AcrR family transcriptional regulator [Clostridium felsineum]URZ04316.1 Fatty acid metabolism regulator protein [Clostridium felsineum]